MTFEHANSVSEPCTLLQEISRDRATVLSRQTYLYFLSIDLVHPGRHLHGSILTAAPYCREKWHEIRWTVLSWILLILARKWEIKRESSRYLPLHDLRLVLACTTYAIFTAFTQCTPVLDRYHHKRRGSKEVPTTQPASDDEFLELPQDYDEEIEDEFAKSLGIYEDEDEQGGRVDSPESPPGMTPGFTPFGTETERFHTAPGQSQIMPQYLRLQVDRGPGVFSV